MFGNIFKISTVFFLALCLLFGAAPAMAGTNVGRANFGADPDAGDADNITDSATITVTAAALSVVKLMFADDGTGTLIASGTSVPRGTVVKFMIYIDNPTGVAIQDVRIEDLLAEADFTYQANSLYWNNMTTASGAAPAAIFTDADAGGAGVQLTQAVDLADVGSIDTTLSPNDRFTVGAHTAQTNAQLDIPAGRIAAFIFRATVNN